MSCNVNLGGGLVPKDQLYSNLTVQNHLVAKRVTAQRIVANTISTSQLLTDGVNINQTTYFANEAVADAPAIILTINEVSESFSGLGSVTFWPDQFIDGTYWAYDLGPTLFMKDGAVGAYLQWSGVLVPEDGVYEFRIFYSALSPNVGDTNGIFQVYVDGVVASSNTVDFSSAIAPSSAGLGIFRDIELTDGFHDVQLRCVSGAASGSVSMAVSGLFTLVKVGE